MHEAISGARYAWFRAELYHLPIERGALPLSRRRSVRFIGRTRGALLLVHGFSQNRFAWHIRDRSMANFLAEAGYDVFFLDLRGSRESRQLGAPIPVGVHEVRVRVKRRGGWREKQRERASAASHPRSVCGRPAAVVHSTLRLTCAKHCAWCAC